MGNIRTLGSLQRKYVYNLSLIHILIFTTHSPHLLANFSSRQLCQIILDEDSYSVAKKKTNISSVLDDLGYNASDLMNVDFVFIVDVYKRQFLEIRMFFFVSLECSGTEKKSFYAVFFLCGIIYIIR